MNFLKFLFGVPFFKDPDWKANGYLGQLIFAWVMVGMVLSVSIIVIYAYSE